MCESFHATSVEVPPYFWNHFLKRLLEKCWGIGKGLNWINQKTAIRYCKKIGVANVWSWRSEQTDSLKLKGYWCPLISLAYFSKSTTKSPFALLIFWQWANLDHLYFEPFCTMYPVTTFAWFIYYLDLFLDQRLGWHIHGYEFLI